VALAGAGFEWPHTRAGQPLCFVGQLNGGDINAALGQDRLPVGAVLALFYEADQQQGWGFDPGNATAQLIPACQGGCDRTTCARAGQVHWRFVP
jgi:hypothetical protein